MMENTILCYGDSNTWGYEPLTGMRLLRKQRWTGVLQQLLRESYYVVEEGLNGRTTVWEEPFRDGRNGLKALLPVLESHAPLALVILMLGTNDLKHHLNVSAHESSSGIAALVQTIHQSAAGLHDAAPPKILVVAPCKFGELPALLNHDYEGGAEKSALLPIFYRQVCVDLHCEFLDANEVATAGDDGIHLNAAGHRQLAAALAPVVRKLVDVPV